ncbi:MAG: tetratricopeptide repeat protein [Acidobacteria bacterium]|nr:tetratricopeptide repeat protein [Acidobacteriota bacterium]
MLITITSSAMGQVVPRQTGECQAHLKQAREMEIADDPAAEQQYRLAIEVEQGYPEASIEFSRFLYQRLRFREAASTLEGIVLRVPLQSRDGYRATLIDLQRAATISDRLQLTGPPQLSDLLELGGLIGIYSKDRFRSARSIAELAVGYYPSSAEAQLLLASTLSGSDERALKGQVLRRAVKLDGTNPKAHFELGWYYLYDFRNLPEALSEFDRALEVSNGQCVEAWQGKGWTLVYLGRKDDGIRAFQTYLDSGKGTEQTRSEVQRVIRDLMRNGGR